MVLVGIVACAAAVGCRGRVAVPAPEAPRAQTDAPLGGSVAADVNVTPAPPAPPPLCLDEPPGPRALRLLTRAEYDATLLELVRDDTRPAQTTFPAPASLTGFENDADQNLATPVFIEAAQAAAEQIAARAWRDHRAELLNCDAALLGETACGEQLIVDFGARAFRRPLHGEEVAIFIDLFATARATWGFEKASELVVAAALQSPQFLYVMEQPSDQAVADPYVIASRLSYLIWGTMPDAALFDAARDGMLSTAEDTALQARRMLADPRARDGLRAFFRQWLGLDRLAGTQKDTVVYPTWTPEARTSWQRSIDAFIDHVMWEGSATISELFTSPVVYFDPILASMMDVAGPEHDAMTAVNAPASQRAGILTQPALMALLSPSDQSSPIRRGVFVREKILCYPLDPPPPEVVVQPPDPDPNATTRERFAAHTADPFCAGCHVLIDPLGFGFERYDGLGRYRTVENGLPVDATGALTEIDEPSIEGPYDGAVELSQRLAISSVVRSCVAKQAFRFAAGRMEDERDHCTIEELENALAASSGNFKDMFTALAASTAFRAPAVAP